MSTIKIKSKIFFNINQSSLHFEICIVMSRASFNDLRTKKKIDLKIQKN